MEIQYHALVNKVIDISPYTTAQEKDVLLMQEFDKDAEHNLRQALKIFGLKPDLIDELSSDDCKAVLYKFREISLGDEIEIRYKCPHCKSAISADVSIANVVHYPDYAIEGIKDLRRLPRDSDDFALNFLSTDIDDMSIDEFEEMYRNCPNFQTTYRFTAEATCPLCRKTTNIDISKPEFVLKTLSEDTLKSLYSTYEMLIYHGKWSKGDIDSLLPFERKIFVSLLMKTLEKRLKK